MKKSIIQEKSYQFALKIIGLYKKLSLEQREYVLSKQILRSGTSIGANIEEATGAHSRKDFLSKLTMAYKEARETDYWLRLLTDTGTINSGESEVLRSNCLEILKIIGSIQKTIKNNELYAAHNS